MTAEFRSPPDGEAAMLMQAIDNMNDGLIVLDSQDRFVLCNDRYREFYPEVLDMFIAGTPLDEIIDIYAARTRSESHDAETFARLRNQSWRAGESMEEVTPAGLWIETRDHRTETGYWIGIRIDVTQRRKAEQQVRDLNETLERRVAERSRELADAHATLLRKERLAVLGELTGTVAHELRNPLGTIASSVEIFKAKVAGKNLDVETALERVNRSIVRCDTIIEELLTFARTSNGQPQATEFDDWLADILKAMSGPVHIAINASLDAPGVEVQIDRERLRRAVLNVISNAVDAVMERESNSDGEIRVSTSLKDAQLHLRIEDNGPGIPERIKDKILDPLFSTKSFGFGLGLPFVARVLEEHHGGLNISNGHASGALVEMWLPLA